MRKLDAWENECIPKVDVKGGQVVFGDVAYKMPTRRTVTVENTGQVRATFRFVPKLEEQQSCKPWLNVEPAFGMLLPGEKVDITLNIFVDEESARSLGCGEDTLEDILVMRLENGRDFFITVTGTYLRSCYGSSLNFLVRTTEPVRSVPITATDFALSATAMAANAAAPSSAGGASGSGVGSSVDSKGPSTLSIPKELWRIVDVLFRSGAIQVQDIFLVAGQ